LPLLFFDPRGLAIALRLVVDDVPAVRTRNARPVYRFLNTDFSAEIVVFPLLKEHVPAAVIADVVTRWLALLERRTAADAFGELATVFVDEFFLARELLAEAYVAPLGSILTVRRHFIHWARSHTSP
jgi:hypothetical protein